MATIVKDQKKKKKDKKVTSTGDSLAAKFPSIASWFDGGAGESAARTEFGGIAKGGNPLTDLHVLLLHVKNNPEKYDLDSPEGIKAFDVLVANTGYVIKTIEAERVYDFQAPVQKAETLRLKKQEIASDFGDLSLTPAQLEHIARFAARNGYTKGSLALKQFVYQQVGANNAKAVKDSDDAREARRIAKSYGYNPPDLDGIIKKILAGEPDADGVIPTLDSLAKVARANALGMYPHLKLQLDNNSSLSDIFGSYRDRASRTLEMPADQIDFNDPKFAAAFGNGETGQMSLGDFDTLIRTNDKYGYQFTKQANKDGGNIGLMLAQMFGKVE